MTNEKVVVTKEVAEAIEFLRNKETYNTDAKLIIGHAETLINAAGTRNNWGGSKVSVLNEVSMDTFARAILNGYTVEKSPEEEVREYFTEIKRLAERAGKEAEYNAKSEFQSEMLGVVTALNKLGIKIGGVNA